jgi:hypothetical protein
VVRLCFFAERDIVARKMKMETKRGVWKSYIGRWVGRYFIW